MLREHAMRRQICKLGVSGGHVGLEVAFPLPPGLPRYALAGFASHDSTRACFPVLVLFKTCADFLLKKQR